MGLRLILVSRYQNKPEAQIERRKKNNSSLFNYEWREWREWGGKRGPTTDDTENTDNGGMNEGQPIQPRNTRKARKGAGTGSVVARRGEPGAVWPEQPSLRMARMARMGREEPWGGSHPELGLPAVASREGGSRDLGMDPPPDAVAEAEMLRLRRVAPALSMTGPFQLRRAGVDKAAASIHRTAPSPLRDPRTVVPLRCEAPDRATPIAGLRAP